MLASVDVGLLAETAWISLLSGVTVTVLFSLVVLFGARSGEARRAGSAGRAMVYAAAAVLSIAVFAVVVGYGVQVMLSKG